MEIKSPFVFDGKIHAIVDGKLMYLKEKKNFIDDLYGGKKGNGGGLVYWQDWVEVEIGVKREAVTTKLYKEGK